MRAAARNAPQVRRPSVSAAGGNLEIGRIHFGRFESDHGVPGESGAFCGASSSIKPDRVRGVIFAVVIAPFLGVLVWRRKNKRSRPLALGRERLPLRGATQIQGPAGLLLPPVVRGGCRGRLRPRSAAVLRPGRPGRSQRCAPLCGAGDWGTAAASARYRCDCMRFAGICQAMGRLEGLTMHRQSRSPRARPSTSTSAVAMLLAKGMLFLSHRREM